MMAMIGTIKTYDKRHRVWGIYIFYSYIKDFLGTRMLIPQTPTLQVVLLLMLPLQYQMHSSSVTFVSWPHYLLKQSQFAHMSY